MLANCSDAWYVSKPFSWINLLNHFYSVYPGNVMEVYWSVRTLLTFISQFCKWCYCKDCVCVSVCEVVRTLQLSSERERSEMVGDLSVCLDGLQVDPETFASEERKHSWDLLYPHKTHSACFQQQLRDFHSLLFNISVVWCFSSVTDAAVNGGSRLNGDVAGR